MERPEQLRAAVADRPRSPQEDEFLYRMVTEGSLAGVYLLQEEKFLYVNPMFAQIFGYRREEILRLADPWNLVHPEDLPLVQANIRKRLAGELDSVHYTFRGVRQDGTLIYCEALGRHLEYQGQPAILGTLLDITARQQAEAAAEEIRRQQEAILSNIPDIAWLKDRESRYIAVNEPFAKICGVSTQDLVGKADLDLWTRELALRYLQDDQEVMRTGRRKCVEEPLIDKGNNLVWVETVKTPIFGEQNEIIGTTGIARDISERRCLEEALHKFSRALKAITECDQALLRASNDAELLEEVCRIIVEVGGYRMAWVGFAGQDKQKTVRCMARYGFDEGYVDLLNVSWADTVRGQGPVGTAIRTGKPIIIRDIQDDPRFAPWRPEALKRGYASMIALPLKNGRTLGALAIYAAERDAFDEEEVKLLVGLANDLAYGLMALRASAERQRAEEALKESEQKLRLLTSQLLTAQENERRRVSRELHDELGQALTVLKFHLVSLEDKLGKDQRHLQRECERLLMHIDQIIENVRRLSWDLSPSILEDLGLTSSLGYLVDEICKNHQISCSMEMDDINHLFSTEAQINIYRIFQESLTNIIKHAQATRVSVIVKRRDSEVTFRLEDNGRGFDLAEVLSRNVAEKRLGLTAMQERARLAGGALTIRSQKGKGTRISFNLPLNPPRHENVSHHPG
jgi:PAS domain S-box-containing protein